MTAPWLATAIAVLLLAGIATLGLGLYRVHDPWQAVLALARAVVQLAALSLVLTGILQDPLWVGIGLAVMLVAAIVTAALRSRGPVLPLAVSIAAGPVAVLLIVFATGAVEFSPRYVLAVGGIIVGNTMTIAILSQRVFRTAVIDHWDEVEGWLALGATARQSTIDLGRGAVRTSLLPSIDQTRTTGIVVLPGAFVGAIFAGASPLEAGRFQLVVLAGVLAAGVVTSVILTRWGGNVRVRPAAS